MNAFLRNLKLTWYYMFAAPWHHSERSSSESEDRARASVLKALHDLAITHPFDVRRVEGKLEPGRHWFRWTVGWMYAISGIVGGALVAPLVVQRAGLSWFPYQDWLAIGIAAIAGFLVHLLGWILLANSFVGANLFFRLVNRVSEPTMRPGAIDMRSRVVILVLGTCAILSAAVGLLIALLLPIAAVCYGIYRYLSLIGPAQRTVTVAFVGGLVVKTLISPLIKNIVGGAVVASLLRWLRGDKTKAKSG